MSTFSRYYMPDGQPQTPPEGVDFVPYKGGHGEVTCLKDMSPEKQKEMLELYSEPNYTERLLRRQRGVSAGS